jgi:hypothetical protein
MSNEISAATEHSQPTTPPREKKIPAKPEGFRRVSLYSPTFRGQPGDRVKGWVLAVQANMQHDGSAADMLMWNLVDDAPVIRFDENGTKDDIAKKDEIIGVPITGADVGRLVLWAANPDFVQLAELHVVDVDGVKRYVCFVSETAGKRADHDPFVQAQIAAAKDAAKRAANGG